MLDNFIFDYLSDFFGPYFNCFSYKSCDKKLTRIKILRNKTSTLKEVFLAYGIVSLTVCPCLYCNLFQVV